MVATRCTSKGLQTLLLLLGVFLLLFGLSLVGPYLGDVQLGQHAVERHGADADVARDWIEHNAGPQHRYDCPDGRVRVVVAMGRAAWAVMVLDPIGPGEWAEVTAFTSADQGYIRGLIDPCSQWMNFAHP